MLTKSSVWWWGPWFYLCSNFTHTKIVVSQRERERERERERQRERERERERKRERETDRLGHFARALLTCSFLSKCQGRNTVSRRRNANAFTNASHDTHNGSDSRGRNMPQTRGRLSWGSRGSRDATQSVLSINTTFKAFGLTLCREFSLPIPSVRRRQELHEQSCRVPSDGSNVLQPLGHGGGLGVKSVPASHKTNNLGALCYGHAGEAYGSREEKPFVQTTARLIQSIATWGVPHTAG